MVSILSVNTADVLVSYVDTSYDTGNLGLMGHAFPRERNTTTRENDMKKRVHFNVS